LATFDMDIAKYKNHMQDVLSEDPTHNVKFIRVDCTKLKQQLVGHCQQWQQRLTGLLHKLSTGCAARVAASKRRRRLIQARAHSELNELHEMFNSSMAKLQRRPKTMDELGDSLTLLKKLQDESAAINGKFTPLEEKVCVCVCAPSGSFPPPPSDGNAPPRSSRRWRSTTWSCWTRRRSCWTAFAASGPRCRQP
jgi:dynein heavy chain